MSCEYRHSEKSGSWVWPRACVYMVVVGGGWLVVLPLLLLLVEAHEPLAELRSVLLVCLGAGLFCVGAVLAGVSGYSLLRHGVGPPWPLDPPRRLFTVAPIATFVT